MGYAQWVSVKIEPKDLTATVKNVSASYGKFYSGTKDNEVEPSAIDGTEIDSGDAYPISACGRDSSPTGTTGNFDLYDSDVKIGTYSWNVPYSDLGGSNESVWTPADETKYLVQQSGANLDSGALGNIELKVTKITT